MIGLLSVFAEFELDMIRERVKAGIALSYAVYTIYLTPSRLHSCSERSRVIGISKQTEKGES